MEGEVGLVAGRSQREKRRSYKDLLREEEEIDAQVRKSSKKRPKDTDGFLGRGDFHKKKKKKHDDLFFGEHGAVTHHRKRKKSSDGHHSLSSSTSSFSPQPAVTAMGLLQAITSPMATGSDPSPPPPKKPLYPPMSSMKERKRDGAMLPKSTKKRKQQVREPLPIVGEEVELEGQYSGPYGQLYGNSSSSSDDDDDDDEEEMAAGKLVIDDSYSQYSMKAKKSKKSKKKKEKEKERKHSHKGSKKMLGANGSLGGDLYAIHDQNQKKKKKEKSKFKEGRENEKAKRKPITAYQIFCKEYRISILEEEPGIDMNVLSKRLAEAWKQLPEGDKQVWRERARYLQHKHMKAEASNAKHPKQSPSKLAKDTTKPKGQLARPLPVSSPVKKVECVAAPAQNGPAVLLAAPVEAPPRSPVRDSDVDPIDAAAHLQLLGESLSLIGRRLQETEGMVTVSGSLSVLLDSMLCALGPLACLTAQVPELNGCSHHTLANTLDNIAYVMPGL